MAAGYFLRKSGVSGTSWTAYASVKMKYGGDLAHFAKLISRLPPSRGWYANTITKSRDRRWSLNIQGIVAYALLREVRPYLHNEKSAIEVDCILIARCGARNVRRGVWHWPQIDDENDSDTLAHSG